MTSQIKTKEDITAVGNIYIKKKGIENKDQKIIIILKQEVP